ncbi:MAG: glycosyltransferase family 2 protein [Isosphaeraceae bacterium]|nr:glycosyltransferase family 2 protein [Isosphaeraceae bacterium]
MTLDTREASVEHEDSSLDLTVVMPCLNEAETLETCIRKTLETFARHGIRGEVIIADNGSTDGSQALAERCGARVVHVAAKGYGNALAGGIAAAGAPYVIMGDSDDSYDFRDCPKFLEKLREGHDLVMGNRFRGGILPGAMPPLHQYFGNPGLTWLSRLFFRCPVGDLYCGLRGFRKASVEKLDLRTTGMEYATEMVIKATLYKMSIVEVPTVLSPDGRSRPPHLRSWRDGWRTLRFMLLYSPRWLFLYPGFLLMLIGFAMFAIGLLRPSDSSEADTRLLLLAVMSGLLGFQSIVFAVFSKTFSLTTGLIPPDPRMERLFKVITLETGIFVAALLMVLGIAGMTYSAWTWNAPGSGTPPLGPIKGVRPLIPSIFSLVLGFQVLTSSFFMSVLGLGRR